MVETTSVRPAGYGTRAKPDPYHHHHVVHLLPGLALPQHPRRHLDGHLVDPGWRTGGIAGAHGGDPATAAGVAQAASDRHAARLHLHRRDHGHSGRTGIAVVRGVHVGDHRQWLALRQQLSTCRHGDGQPECSQCHPDFALLESQSLFELGLAAGLDCGAAVLRFVVACDDARGTRSAACQPGQEPFPGQYESRIPHPVEWLVGHDRSAGHHASGCRAEGMPEYHPGLGAQSAVAGGRGAGYFRDRGGQDPYRSPRFRCATLLARST